MQKNYKNGGFPPIKYCPVVETNDIKDTKTTKERFFSNVPTQNINIRQLLADSNIKKPLIITDNVNDDIIEEVASL